MGKASPEVKQHGGLPGHLPRFLSGKGRRSQGRICAMCALTVFPPNPQSPGSSHIRDCFSWIWSPVLQSILGTGKGPPDSKTSIQSPSPSTPPEDNDHALSKDKEELGPWGAGLWGGGGGCSCRPAITRVLQAEPGWLSWAGQR